MSATYKQSSRVDPDKLAHVIEDLKKKTNSANEMVSQSLMMKQVAEAAHRAIDKANKNLKKKNGSHLGGLG